MLLLSTLAAATNETIRVSTNRYSVFAPYSTVDQINYDADNSSFTFTAGALVIGANGSPLANTNVNFYIYSGNGALKKSGTVATNSNGIAFFSYNTFKDFTSISDTDYGIWTIKAALASDESIYSNATVNIDISGGTCGKGLCHNNPADTTTTSSSPRSPYSDNFGIASTSSMAYGAHIVKGGTHGVSSSSNCKNCHIGLDREPSNSSINAPSGVHKNIDCITCHQNPNTWPITIPNCYSSGCHPRSNNNLTATNTLANIGGISNVSIYSTTNGSIVVPYSVHNGSQYGNTTGVPCWICHGPEHNITKPDPLPANTNNITESTQCISCHGEKHFVETSCTDCHSQDAHNIIKPRPDNCALCHSSYVTAVNNSMHNQTKNPAAPNCTLCHTGYDVQHTGLIVNESNTCRNSGCHEQNVSGFYERHTSSSDCTACHFANTTQKFDKNQSLYTHDHNLTVEHNFYEYNISGMPVRTNNGTGVGMFPYYTCTLTCHKYNATTGVEGKIDEAAKSWFNSSHAQSLHMSGDNKMSCAKCKSPANYNVSANQSSLIAQADWQGIQCRVCHNLHDRKFPNNTGPSGFPIAFYNSTSSSRAGYAVYEQVPNSTVLCQNCHYGTSHDSKFAGVHRDTVRFNCTDCHMNSSFNNELHTFEVKNTTSGITGCEVCHNPANHIFQWTSKHTGKVECVACHDQTVSRNATNYSVSPDNNYGIYKDTTTNEWTTYKVSHGSAATWPLHNVTLSVNCSKCHGATSVFSGQIAPEIGEGCAQCHASYANAVNSSMHNQTKNAAAPNCTSCHAGYDIQHSGFVVNETNTCRNCHIDNVSGFYERHTSSSDCTTCHFANTTQKFDKNQSLFTHDHNLTIEHNFYEYNQSGIPLIRNNGTGLGMFSYYSCQLPCHGTGYGNVTSRTDLNLDNAASSWNESAHAKSRHGNETYDSKNSCAKCKSPPNYNASASSSAPIAEEDWQGIQCRVCHNLHDRRFPNNTGPSGFPVAFYNSTSSSQSGYAVYEQVSNATVLCQKCHTGTSHDSKFAGTHQDAPLNFTCTSCHKNNTFNNESHLFEVKNTTSGVTGCEVCHKAADHTFQWTSKHTGKVECVACHDQTVSRNATGYAVSPDNSYGIYKDTTTNEWTTYKVSHGAPATWPLHNITRSVSCDKCHNATSVFSGVINSTPIENGQGCIQCHPNISEQDIGLHSGFSGTSAVDEGDCRTCHYGSFEMVKGAANNSNTYFCADCHTSAGTSPNKSSIIFTDKKHGEVSCMDCHVADGKYHQGNPRGAIANQTYINRYLPGNTTVTDCADCHYASNLDDAPFNAPGAGTHSKNACSDGGCHNAGTTTMVQTVHRVDPQVSGNIPSITVPILSSSSVTQGTNVTVNATVTVNSFYNFVDGAQYRIMSGGTPVLPWTPMSPVNSSFDGATEDAAATISTNIPVGTYTVEVRGMAGGPAQNAAVRYYPMNGDVSSTNSTILTIQPPKGYINGTVTSGGLPVQGVYVSTAGANDTTKPDGTYSLGVPEGAYTVNASKQPTHYDSTVAGVVVTSMNTTTANIVLEEKPTGAVTGSITNA